MRIGIEFYKDGSSKEEGVEMVGVEKVVKETKSKKPKKEPTVEVESIEYTEETKTSDE